MILFVGACGAGRSLAQHGASPPATAPTTAWRADVDPQRALLEATRAVRRGDDAAAISWAEEGLRVEVLEESLMVELRRVLVAALARGGPPERALMEARSLQQDARHLTTEHRRAVGVALDRGVDAEAAALALMSWREVLDDAEPEARYVESRLLARLDGLSTAALERMWSAATSPEVRMCIETRLGTLRLKGRTPPWVARCVDLPETVGVALPRTGALSRAAGEHLAALSVGVALLSETRPVNVLFEDAGSTAASAKEAALRLTDRGAQWIVGPLAAAQALSAATVGTPVASLTQGPGLHAATAGLDARVWALMGQARDEGARRLLVLAPDNAYGQSALAAARRAGEAVNLTIDERRFAEDGGDLPAVLDGVMGKLSDSGAVMVLDALGRVDFVVRQLRRREREGSRALVLSTAEGMDPGRLAAAGSALEGAVVAPLVGPIPTLAAFDEAFASREGRRPSDQARAVFQALVLAWTGGRNTGNVGGTASPAPAPALFRVTGGSLVALGS